MVNRSVPLNLLGKKIAETLIVRTCDGMFWHATLSKGVPSLPRREAIRWKLTVEYVYDPAAVDQALQAWTDFLAEAVKTKARERVRSARQGGDQSA